MARRVVRPAQDTTRPMNHAAQTPQLLRACRLLRDRLNRLEDPGGPLTVRERRRLSHQTSRLARVVEAMVFRSSAHEDERRAA